MKTFIFSALALGMMASCSNTEVEGIDAVDNGEPVAIQLSAGVQTAATVSRALIENGSKFTATVLGCEATDETQPTFGTIDWNINTEEITASSTAVSFSLKTPQYYQSNGNKTWMKAISPVGTVSGSTYTFSSVLNAVGDTDVLVSKAVSGDKANPSVSLIFAHALAQFNFILVKGDGLEDNVKVTKITMKGVQLPTAVNLSDNSLVLAGANPIDALDVDAENGTVITAGGAEIKSSIMVAPIIATALKLDIETTAGNFTDVAVKPAAEATNFEAGTSYKISLTFRKKAVETEASVTPWKEGTGSGTVE